MGEKKEITINDICNQVHKIKEYVKEQEKMFKPDPHVHLSFIQGALEVIERELIKGTNTTHMYSLDDLEALLLEISEATNSNADITIDGKTYKTDTGYAFQGMEIFLDILHRRENNEHN